MKAIVVIFALVLGLSGCALEQMAQSQRAEQKRVQDEATERRWAARRAERDAQCAVQEQRKEVKPSKLPAVASGSAGIAITDGDILEQARVRAAGERREMIGMMAQLRKEFGELGADSIDYAEQHETFMDWVAGTRVRQPHFEMVMADLLDKLPAEPSEQAKRALEEKRRYEAERAAREREVAAEEDRAVAEKETAVAAADQAVSQRAQAVAAQDSAAAQREQAVAAADQAAATRSLADSVEDMAAQPDVTYVDRRVLIVH